MCRNIHVLGLRVQTSAIGKRTFVCMHRAVHKETTNQHNNITTSTMKSQPAQQYHQRNVITTRSPTQQHHQHSNIISTTRSPPPATLHTLPTAHSTLHTMAQDPLCRKCVSPRPLVMRGIFARKRENGQQNAKTRKPRKRENGQQNAKTRKPRKRENAHGSTRARKLDSYDHLRI